AGANFDREVIIQASDIIPTVTWGTSPEQVLPVNQNVPSPDSVDDASRKEAIARALNYMGLEAGQPLSSVKVDKIFIGSCTNGRIEDLRIAASVLKGRKVASHITGLVVSGSGLVKKQAEEEGLDIIFKEAGLEWREPGCSMCLAMNADRLKEGE